MSRRAILQVQTPPGSPTLTEMAYGTPQGFGSGPIVASVSWDFVQGVLADDPSQLAGYLNRVMMAAEAAAPEGAWMQLDLQGWSNPVTGTSYASDVAAEIQSAYASGQITDPSSGEVPGTWDTQQGVLATGDPSSDTVTLRWVKGQLFLLWIFVGLLVAVAVVVVWNYLRSSSWGQFAGLPSGVTGTIPKAPATLTPLDRYVLILAGVSVAGLFGYAWWRIEVAKAGASRSEQIIEIGR